MTDVVLAQAQSQLNMTAALVLPGRAMAGSGSDLLQASVRSWVSCPPVQRPAPRQPRTAPAQLQSM